MPWMRVEVDAPDHPKTQALAARLGISRAHAFGLIASVWAYACRYHPDGDLAKADMQALHKAIGWSATGARDVALVAENEDVRFILATCGFIDVRKRKARVIHLYLHDWEDYQGIHVQRRVKDKIRKRLERERIRALSSGRTVDRPQDSPDRPQDVHTYVTVRNGTVRNDTGRNERVAGPPAALDYATRCVVAANHALSELRAGAYKSLQVTLERPIAVTWEAAGIPVELAERVITERIKAYTRPGQPHTLKYFDGALREAWERTRAAGAADVPLTDADRMRAARLQLETQT